LEIDMEIQEGDIVLAPFRFSETEEAKLRPSLVWKITPVGVVLVYISSQHVCESGGYSKEVGLALREAETIGLIKPSRIDFGKRDVCHPSQIRKVYGRIQNLPRKTLERCTKAAYQAGLLGL
jgi:hypothetical protein